jgi:hypothetical protein
MSNEQILRFAHGSLLIAHSYMNSLLTEVSS